MRNHNYIKKQLKSISSISLLLLYLGVFLFVPTLEHNHHHNDNDAQNCSAENEINPCHRLIFHHDLFKGCSHHEHLLAEKQDCDLCDLILTSSPKIISESDDLTIDRQSSYFLFFNKVHYSTVVKLNQSTRAPPIQSLS